MFLHTKRSSYERRTYAQLETQKEEEQSFTGGLHHPATWILISFNLISNVIHMDKNFNFVLQSPHRIVICNFLLSLFLICQAEDYTYTYTTLLKITLNIHTAT